MMPKLDDDLFDDDIDIVIPDSIDEDDHDASDAYESMTVENGWSAKYERDMEILYAMEQEGAFI